VRKRRERNDGVAQSRYRDIVAKRREREGREGVWAEKIKARPAREEAGKKVKKARRRVFFFKSKVFSHACT